MIDRQMKNEKGFTLIELLLAMALAIIVLGTSIYTYTRQDKLLRVENRNIQTRDFARLAMDQLLNDLLFAGYGFPPGDSAEGRAARGITNADATTITFMANTEDISTYASFDSTDPNNTGLVVADPTVFTIGDHVIFFDVEKPTKWNTKTFTSQLTIPGVGEFMGWGTGASARNVTVGTYGGGGDGIYVPITDNSAVELNNFHVITYTYNVGAQTITVSDDQGTATNGDDTTTIVANNVSDVTFTYFDADANPLTTLPLSATDLGNVRRMGISITVVNGDDPDITATLLTDINLRNMGL